MEELLIFIEENNFLRYGDKIDKWYSTKLQFNKLDNKGYKTIYYTKKELIKLLEDEYREIRRITT
jgi:hypothetical protein